MYSLLKYGLISYSSINYNKLNVFNLLGDFMQGIATCLRCGITFKYCRANSQKKAFYCSWKCFAQKKQKSNCLFCDKEFKFWKSVRPRAIFCSRLCQNTYQSRKRMQLYHETINNLTNEEMLDHMKLSFERNVIKHEGCWDWRLTKSGKYGRLFYCGKVIPAHRASYLIHRGDIPSNLFVLHKCDNPICTNPDHLFLGTTSDNHRDMIAKNRSNPPRGERARASKLTEEKVKEIRRLLALGVMAIRIANDLGVHKTTVSDIKLGKTWKHIK